jgi:hypothetical protein
MTDITPYTQLRTMVSYALDECDKSMKDFDKFWILAFRALVACTYSISAEPITVRLPVQGNKTVIYPNDCLGVTAVGIMNSGGQISSLKINNALTTYKDNNPNRISHLTSDVNDNIALLSGRPIFFNYYNNGDYYTLYGAGSGLIQYGECRIDETNRLIVLHPEFQYDSVMLGYISSPEKNGDYAVPTVLQEAIIAFIKWKAKLGPEIDFYNRLTEARRSMPNKKVTLQGIAQVIRQDTGFYMHV